MTLHVSKVSPWKGTDTDDWQGRGMVRPDREQEVEERRTERLQMTKDILVIHQAIITYDGRMRLLSRTHKYVRE